MPGFFPFLTASSRVGRRRLWIRTWLGLWAWVAPAAVDDTPPRPELAAGGAARNAEALGARAAADMVRARGVAPQRGFTVFRF